MGFDKNDLIFKLLELTMLFLVFLNLLVFGFYFYDLISEPNTEHDPFNTYNFNSGIIKISIGRALSFSVFIGTFFLALINKYKGNKVIKFFHILSALAIAFLQWFELYYGSTFYFGEVRDKQGLGFPLTATGMLILVIWSFDYSNSIEIDFRIKLALTAILIIVLYLFWRLVYEPWNLWQS